MAANWQKMFAKYDIVGDEAKTPIQRMLKAAQKSETRRRYLGAIRSFCKDNADEMWELNPENEKNNFMK